MVHRSRNSSFGEEEDAVSVLNGDRVVVDEEFPRVVERTEIVRLEEAKTASNVEERLSIPSTATAGGKRNITKCLSDRKVQQQQQQQQQQQGQQNRKSARFSLFNWFKKGNDFHKNETEDNLKTIKYPQQLIANSPRGGGSQNIIYSSSGSVDTTCSTATVHSFTFRSGLDIVKRRRDSRVKYFRKHYSVDDFANGTRKSCVDNQFDSEPSINRGSSILFDIKNEEKDEFIKTAVNNEPDESKEAVNKDLIIASSANNINNDINKTELYCFYRSLPTAGKTADLTNNNNIKKRYSHVRGKRQAPKPPTTKYSYDNKINTARRKRQAPKPPLNKVEIKTNESLETKEYTISTNNSDDLNLPVIINDTLKLEGGILLPIKSEENLSSAVMNRVEESLNNVVKKTSSCSIGQTSSNSIVLPRPWYKRSNTTLSERDICGSFRREVLKIPTLSKSSKEKDKDKGRFSLHNENRETSNNLNDSNSSEINSFDKSLSRLNHIFGRNSDGCKIKKDNDKRKSNLSILTNISELDREAAAIVQEEQARNQAIAKSSFPRPEFNDLDKTPSGDIISELVSASIEPQRKGTRALISKFNAISNITKVTVNSNFFNKSSSNQQQSIHKTDVVRSGEQRNNRNDCNNIVTKRLLCDGTERVNETGADISSINFFRRLEAEASKLPDNSASTAVGWEEKIKRYFPDKNSASHQRQGIVKEEFNKVHSPVSKRTDENERNYFIKQRDVRNFNRSFELHDNRNVDKIEHLSRADLKEMLIEMKHSLPKRPKPKSNSGAKSIVVNNEVRKSIQSELMDNKLPSPKPTTSDDNRFSKLEIRSKSNGPGKQRENEKETIPILDTNNKIKVSSAAQTSANLRKIDMQPQRERQQHRAVEPTRYKSTGIKTEDTIYTTKGRNNANGGPTLTRNTFQLIRPRDFACIKALKTEKETGVAAAAVRESQNTYMNVIEDSIYANTVIIPSKITKDEKSVDKIEIAGNRVIDNNYKRDDDKAPDKLEPRKEEIRVLGTPQGIGGDKKELGVENNMNTMAINRLLRKLEGAIASGQHQQAAGLAKELAQLKIHCSVVRQRSCYNSKPKDFINVDMYIEDKLAHQGPIPLQLPLNMTVAELKNKVFAEFEIPANVQRWIIGKNLANNDDFTINELKAVDKSSIFLYLVAPDLQNDECTQVVDKPSVKEEAVEVPVYEKLVEIIPILEEKAEVLPPEEPTVEELKLKRYEHLMSLENSDVIPNSVPIECPICFAPYGPCEGVILRDCLHMFCRTCIANTIMYCEEAEVKCPFRDSEYTCESTLQEREIKALVTPEIYEQHLAKSVSQAENNAGNNAFHCKTPDCPGWCIYDDNVNIFLCPVCGVNNCLTCQAIHTNKNCREYQDEIRLLKETDQETKRTAAVLEEMVESGEALACPTCAVVLMKKWGCDWLRCSMCKTEICWVTRGPRWGPGGKGDTSGGCKCGENGVKCHPRCNYCH